MNLCKRDELYGLLHFDALVFLFLSLLAHLGQVDRENAVLDLGTDLLLVHILGQHVSLLIVAVVELAAQIVFFLVLGLVFLLVLELVLNLKVEVTVLVKAYAAILFLQSLLLL